KRDAPFGDNEASPCDGLGDAQPSHIVVLWVAANVADEQYHCFVAEILPPVRSTLCFCPYFAGLVHDWGRTVAGVFVDLALGDVDQRGAIVMAVPRNYAARVDHQLAEAELAAGDLGLLLAEIDRAQRGVGDADSLKVDRLARIRHALVGGAVPTPPRGWQGRACPRSA